jgi:hypothetical protein
VYQVKTLNRFAALETLDDLWASIGFGKFRREKLQPKRV